MWTTLAALCMAPALAETLPVDLGDKVATIRTPNAEMAVTLQLKATAEGDTTEVVWENQESSAIAIQCAEKVAAPDDTFVEQLMLAVGDKKWALAPGSSVLFTCPAGKAASVIDVHGTEIGTFPGGLKAMVAKARKHSAR